VADTHHGAEHVPGPRPGSGAAGEPGDQSPGERLLGSLIDRAHTVPPHLVVPLVAQEIATVDCTDIAIYLQDFDQVTLHPLAGEGLVPREPVAIDNHPAGRAFSGGEPVERDVDGGVRLYLPMLDGTDRIGVLAFTLARVDDDARRLSRRLAGLVADMIATKGDYTDDFFNARRAQEMSLPAQLQWQLLPPLTMTTPRISLAGILEPAYNVGGDSFDYALNGEVLHLAIIDAMGHGLDAATMATVAVAAYRQARRAGVSLVDLYANMDRAIATQFPARFATAQMGELDTRTGELTWVNAGHPAPLLLRGRRVVRELEGPTTRPVGFGGATPIVQSVQLEPGDRVLFFTDGVVEERMSGGGQFGERRMHELVARSGGEELPVPETVRRLSHALMRGRAGQTTDDATLFMVEWTGPTGDEDLRREILAILPHAT